MNHIASCVANTLNYRIAQGRAGQSNIVPNHHTPSLEKLGKGATDSISDILVEIIGNAAAYIVGLETA